MNYTDFQNAITIRAVQAVSPYTALPTDFSTNIPRFIDYAEGRIYREIVMLANRKADASQSFSNGSRTLSLTPIVPAILAVEGVAMVTPAATAPALGTRWTFDASSLDVIDILWPVEATTLAPSAADNIGRLWAMKDDHTIVVSPTPDAAYVAEITGLFRPTALSSANATTYLATNYPELMLAAAMIDVSAYLREWGAMADDPRMALSYEEQYKGLLPGAILEEQRRRSQGTGWSANAPAPIAKPERD